MEENSISTLLLQQPVRKRVSDPFRGINAFYSSEVLTSCPSQTAGLAFFLS